MSEDSIFIVNVEHCLIIAFLMKNTPGNTFILFIFRECTRKFCRGEKKTKVHVTTRTFSRMPISRNCTGRGSITCRYEPCFNSHLPVV